MCPKAYSPLLLLATLAAGCSRHPEDPYLGSEHWIAAKRQAGTISYAYDLGSVRRTNSEVIVKLRTIDDVDFDLSGENRRRRAARLPLHLGSSSVLVLNCSKRTYRPTHLVGHFEQGVDMPSHERRAEVIVPGSPMEEIYDALCS